MAVALIKIVSTTLACKPESAICEPVFVPRRLGLLGGYVSKVFPFSMRQTREEGNLRKADSQVRATHTVTSFVLDDAMEMQDERT